MELNTNQTRNFPLTYNTENNTVSVVFSTGARVLRTGNKPYFEELTISNDAIDFSRLNAGANIIDSHNTTTVRNVIGVVESAGIENGEAVARIRFSERDDVAGIVKDVRDGILKNISVGYSIQKAEKRGEESGYPIFNATRWMPAELSFVIVPADLNAQVRSEDLTEQQTIMEGNKMEKEDIKTQDETRSAPVINPDEVIRAERSRIGEITKLCRSANLTSDFAEKLIGDGASIESARSLILDEVIKNQPKVSNTTTLKDAGENFRAGIESAVLIRAGKEKNDEKNEFRGMTLLRMAEEALVISGQSCRGLNKEEITSRSFHTTSDFPLALANVASKSLQKAYETAPERWTEIARIIPVSDFKQITMVGGGEFSDLDEIVEGAEYKHGTLTEAKETFQIATFGKLFSITRQVIIDDDLNFLTDAPAKMGKAAARKIGDLVWAVLNNNAAMSDGVALFHANHGNLGSGAINIASLEAAELLMTTQKDINGQQGLNIQPRNLIVPRSKNRTALTLMAATNDPDATSKIRPNTFAGAFNVVSDPRLDATSTSVWYLQADPNAYDSIVVGFLNGNQSPYMEQLSSFDRDGVSFKVRIDAAAKAVGYKGLVKSTGV